MDHDLIDINQFEHEIKALERKILDHKDQEQLVVFYGSSSIRLWDTLSDDLYPLNTLNLGFGGSSFSWCIYYFDRLFSKLNPSHLVIYVGDNDLGKGIPPDKVLKKFRVLARLIRTAFPEIPVDFITIKPSPERTYLQQEIKVTNNLIRKELMGMNKARLINIFDSMLDENGAARPELYQQDQLHMNEKGYRIWKGVVRKHFGV